MKFISKTKFKLLVLMFISFCITLSAQIIDMDENQAFDEFREGVLSCNAGYFNKAYLHFENSLQYKPQNLQTRYWLAYTLYKNGYTLEANEIFQELASKNYNSDILNARFELLKFRESLAISANKIQYIEAGIIPNQIDGIRYYDKPFSLSTDDKGGFSLISRGTDQVLFYNANGFVDGRIIGDLIGLSLPYDLSFDKKNNLFYLTDFVGDRVLALEKSGRIASKFGKKGISDSAFLGPQYICEDKDAYLYITDSGNKRVLKYTKDGQFILSFGKANSFFEGFLLPTGIIAQDDALYVADQFRKKIYKFDFSGNYLETVISKGLYSPESLSSFGEGYLLLADRKQVLSIDIKNKTTSVLTDLDGKAEVIVDAELDSNGNIIISDFQQNKVFVYTDIRNLYVGLEVEIDSINTFDFPNIVVNARVKDKSGNPFLGMEKENFQILQNNVPITNFNMIYNDTKDDNIAIAVIRDNSKEMSSLTKAIEKGLKDFFPSFRKDDFVSVVSPGEYPEVVYKKRFSSVGIDDFVEMASSLVAEEKAPSTTVFDYSIRTATSSLLNIPSKKAILYFSSGEFPESYYKDYGLIKVADLLKNNGIIFNCVILKSDVSVCDDLVFLAEHTGGQIYYTHSLEGTTKLVENLRESFAGRYSFHYKLQADSKFGQEYFAVDLSAFVMKRSGLGSSGFFAQAGR